MATTGVTEARAKRTHARRSCQTCQQRKTRCELPDLDVPPGPTPLSEDKACHRCRVLVLPCIVNDVGRVPKKKQHGESGDVSASGTPRASGRKSGAHTTDAEDPRGEEGTGQKRKGKSKATSGSRVDVDHSLEVLHSVHPALTWTTDTHNGNVPSNLHAADPFFYSPQSPTAVYGMEPLNSIRLHGRPLELVSAMMRMAYAKTDILAGRSEYVHRPTDWDTLVDLSMRRQLEEMGYSQLRTYHPYLDPFSSQFERLAPSFAPNDQLLLALIVYLCTFPLPPSSAVTRLREQLRPIIAFHRDRVLLTVPESFSTIQALDLLSLHAPLGVIPLQLTDPRTLTLSRGHMSCLKAVSVGLGFDRLFETISRLGTSHLWVTSDAWLYMTIAAQEACMTLENEVSRAPPCLAELRLVAAEWLDERSEHLWRSGVLLEPAEMIGRLAVCDRIIRVADVLDSLERFRSLIDSASVDPQFDVVDGILQEFGVFARNAERSETRHDAILAILSPHTRMLESGSETYRSIRRRYEHSKILGAGIRCLIALAFLPGHPHALPPLNGPTEMPPHHRVSYAMHKAFVPGEIMPALTHQSPASMAIWQYGPHRETQASAIIAAFAELDRVVIPQPRRETGDARGDLVPLHEIFAITVESCKIAMETRAGKIAMTRNRPDLMQAPHEVEWYEHLRKSVNVLRRIDLLSTPYGNEGGPGHTETRPGEGETVANGCSNVIGSMLRLAEGWSKGVERLVPEQGSGSGPGRGQGSSSAQSHGAAPMDGGSGGSQQAWAYDSGYDQSGAQGDTRDGYHQQTLHSVHTDQSWASSDLHGGATASHAQPPQAPHYMSQGGRDASQGPGNGHLPPLPGGNAPYDEPRSLSHGSTPVPGGYPMAHGGSHHGQGPNPVQGHGSYASGPDPYAPLPPPSHGYPHAHAHADESQAYHGGHGHDGYPAPTGTQSQYPISHAHAHSQAHTHVQQPPHHQHQQHQHPHQHQHEPQHPHAPSHTSTHYSAGGYAQPSNAGADGTGANVNGLHEHGAGGGHGSVPPTALDMLLGQMFNYAYAPPGPGGGTGQGTGAGGASGAGAGGGQVQASGGAVQGGGQ